MKVDSVTIEPHFSRVYMHMQLMMKPSRKVFRNDNAQLALHQYRRGMRIDRLSMSMYCLPFGIVNLFVHMQYTHAQ